MEPTTGQGTQDPVGDEALSPDEIRAAVRDWAAGGTGQAEARRLRDEPGAGIDAAGWRVLAEQIGLAALAAPVQWGGLGLGAAHAVAAIEECGAALYPGPARAAALTSAALHGLGPGESAVAALIPGLLDGSVIPGIAASVQGDGPGDHTAASQVFDDAAPPVFDGAVLHGAAERVLHGDAAGLVLCAARTPDGLVAVLAAVPAGARRTVLTCIDPATRIAGVDLTGAPAVVVADEDGLRRLRTLHRILLAAELTGLAEGALAATVDYVRVRRQFDREIGANQAVQHACADGVIAGCAARALVTAAAAAHDAGHGDQAAPLALLAAAEAGDCATASADRYIHLSGGIGFTWEHDAHLYYRRARWQAASCGTPDRLRDAAALAGAAGLLTAAYA